jgi:hypothetical protein
VAGSCEHDNESSSSIKGRALLGLLNDFQLLKKLGTADIFTNKSGDSD